MAADNTPKLPEDVATDFKYCGNGATNYVVPGIGTVNVETIKPAVAAELVKRGAHFLKKKRKAKAKTTDQK